MTSKTRYLLILACFLVFFILAPLIVFYVSGLAFDFQNHRFIKTGILNINTEPKKSNIYLDGKLASEKSGNIKFLLPKEYEIKIQKQDYFDWTKRLQVEPSQVTWAAQVDKIYLLLNPPKKTDIDSDVLDFEINGNTLAYLTEKQLFISSADNPTQSQKFDLPEEANKIAISPNGKYFVLTSNSSTQPTLLVFETDNSKFVNLGPVISNASKIDFSGSDIYALEDETLYKINLDSLTKEPALQNILDFSFLDNNLYYIQKNDTTSQLYSSQPASEKVLLISNLPAFTKSQIIISPNKVGFLLLDDRLYRIGSSLNLLASDVKNWNFSTDKSNLIFQTGGEVDYYSPDNDSVNLITRNSSPINNLNLDTKTNYAFYFKNSELVAIELDTREHQNEYSLYSGNPGKFKLDSTSKNILLLDNGKLMNLQIR